MNGVVILLAAVVFLVLIFCVKILPAVSGAGGGFSGSTGPLFHVIVFFENVFVTMKAAEP